MSVYDRNGNQLSSVYDRHGNTLTVAYDRHGAEIFSSNHEEQPNVDKFNRVLPYTINLGGWVDNADAQYSVFKSVLDSCDSRAVPMFIDTDEHGSGTMQAHRWFHNHNIADKLEATNLQLGDVSVDYYSTSIMTSMVLQTALVRNYIGIPGNHDGKTVDEVPDATTLRKYFGRANCYRYELTNHDTSASMVVYDDVRKIKYICMDAYTRVGTDYVMPHPFVTKDTMDWLIESLASNDGYDSIFLTHEPFNGFTYVPDITANQQECVWDVLRARKNKRNGAVVDDEGASHAYDFSGMSEELIVCLHGHQHQLVYGKQDNLASVCFNKYATSNLVILDRTSGILRLFQTSYTGITPEVDIPI